MHGLEPWILLFILRHKRSRVTKLGAQTQHRVVLRLVPPSASKQSEIMCARDKCGVFHHIGKAISGSTVPAYCRRASTRSTFSGVSPESRRRDLTARRLPLSSYRRAYSIARRSLSGALILHITKSGRRVTSSQFMSMNRSSM